MTECQRCLALDFVDHELDLSARFTAEGMPVRRQIQAAKREAHNKEAHPERVKI